jgi:putative peptidoglycan lipid II flippase
LNRPRSAAYLLMAATAVSRLLGFVRIGVIGAIFGASGSADVLNAVFMIPNNLRKLLAEGALSAALIPELASHAADHQRTEARALVRRLLTVIVAVTAPLVGLALVFAVPVTRLLLEFPEPAKMQQAAGLFRVIFPYIILVSISAVTMAALNTDEIFLIPAIAPLLFSVFVIAAIATLHGTMGVYAAGIGILVGGAAGILVQLPAFYRRGYSLAPKLPGRDAALARVGRQWLPVVASSSIFALSQQVAIIFATGLEDGSASALANALVFWQLPFGIFSVSIVTAHFPRMSKLAAAGDRLGLAATMRDGLGLIASLLLPAALFYLVLGEPVIRVALERGSFAAAGSQLAGRVLAGYAVGLVPVALFTFTQRYFFATRDFQSPLRAALLVVAIDVPLSFVLKDTSLRVAGLSLANSIAFAAGAAFLLFKVRHQLTETKDSGWLVAPARLLLANAPLALLLLAAGRLAGPWWQPGSTWRNAGLLAGIGLLALAAVLMMYRIMHISLRPGRRER